VSWGCDARRKIRCSDFCAQHQLPSFLSVVFHKNSLKVHRILIQKPHSLLEKLKQTPPFRFDFTKWNKCRANIANVQLFLETLQILFFVSFAGHVFFT